MALSASSLPMGKALPSGGAAGVDGNKAAGLDDTIKGAAVGDQIFQDGKGLRPPGFDGDGVAVLEFAHVQLTGGGAFGAVGHAADHHGAGAANAFATIGVEGDGVFALGDEAFVDDVEHFQERHVFEDIVGLVGDHFAFGGGIFLPPNF